MSEGNTNVQSRKEIRIEEVGSRSSKLGSGKSAPGEKLCRSKKKKKKRKIEEIQADFEMLEQMNMSPVFRTECEIYPEKEKKRRA